MTSKRIGPELVFEREYSNNKSSSPLSDIVSNCVEHPLFTNYLSNVLCKLNFVRNDNDLRRVNDRSNV